MSFAFLVDFLEPTLDFQTPIMFLLEDKNTKYGYLFSKLDCKKNLEIDLSGFVEILKQERG